MNELTFTVTDQEINLIGDALIQLPYKTVSGLLEKLKAQAAAQQIAAQEEKASVEDKKKVKKLQKV